MNRIDRLTAILIWLQSQHALTARQISDRYGVSQRTVYRDIRALEDAGVPIGVEPGRGYFLAEGYHLPPVMFTSAEAGALLLGAKLIEKFSDTGINQSFAGAMDKIKAVMGHEDQDYLNRLDAQITVLKATPVCASATPNNLLLEVQSALAQNQFIHIRYLSGYKEERSDRTIEPLGLCFYAGHWHLLAYCHMRKAYRDFRVDRILATTLSDTRFDRQRHGELDELVRRIVMPTNLKPATVQFTQPAAHAIREYKYFYGFVAQRVCCHGVEMDFLVPDIDYLSRWLLTWTDQVMVKRPETLKAAMAAHSQKLIQHYRYPSRRDEKNEID